MPQKAQPQSLPLVRPLDDPGDVGQHQGAPARELQHAQVRLQRRERVVGDLGPGGGERRQQRALPRVGLPDQPDIGDQLQLQLDAPRLAGASRLVLARGLVRRRREGRVAATAPPAPRHHTPIPGTQ